MDKKSKTAVSLQRNLTARKEAIAQIEAALNTNAKQIQALERQNQQLERDLHTQTGARLQLEDLLKEETGEENDEAAVVDISPKGEQP